MWRLAHPRRRLVVEKFEFDSHPRIRRMDVISKSNEDEIDWTPNKALAEG
jgi:hypothetical protein